MSIKGDDIGVEEELTIDKNPMLVEEVDFMLAAEEDNVLIEGNKGPKSSENNLLDDNEAGEGPSNEGPVIVDNFVTKMQEYEELFKDRYTSTDQNYMGRVEEQINPLVVHPWHQQEQGGWSQQSGERNWRGNQRGRGGRWNNNQQRPQYEGNRRQFDDRYNRKNHDGDRGGWEDAERNKRSRY